MTDPQLLQDYLEPNSEAAFRELVERYLGLVHGTALRLVGDPHMAQEESLRSLGNLLGISEEAAMKRGARALDRLRRLFAARGIILSASALAGLLSQQLAQAAAPPLAASIAAAPGPRASTPSAVASER